MAVEVRMGFVVFLCFLGVALGKDVVPVYIWSSTHQETTSIPALKQLSTQDFADHLNHRLESKPLLLVFTEENLSSEDFSGVQYPKLQTLGKSSEFLPAVQNPIRAVKKVVSRQSSLEDIPAQGSALVIIKMDDARPDEDRGQLLRRHDAKIKQIYQQALKVRDDVLAIYTGHYTSWTEPEVHRVRRLLQDTAPSNSSTLTLSTDNILVYASKMPYLYVNNQTVSLTFIRVTQDIRTKYQSLQATFRSNVTSSPVTMVFYFYNTTSTSGYWSLENVTYTETESGKPVVFVPDTSIIVPVGFSYHCTAGTTLKNENGVLMFTNFQAQAYMSNKGVFGDAYNCELFFTAPIWSGLFVMTILAMIMIWGLAMIMDIRTMDQFDDPKGKTITINTLE